MNKCWIWVLVSNGSPVETKRVASFPTSSEPILLARPKISAGTIVTAFKAASSAVRELPDYEVPMHLRNAPTKMMKEMDYGKGYRYAHGEENAFAAGEHYFPQEMNPCQWYEPQNRGLEIQIAEKLQQLRQLNAKYRE